MNEIEKFANEVCGKRSRIVETKKAEIVKERLVEKYVRDIIDIFNISNNSEESTILIWRIKLFKDYDMLQVDEILLSFSIYIEDDRCKYSIDDFEHHKDWGDNSELIQKVRNMIIPKDLYNDIINYFKTKLSKQFEITTEGDGSFGKEGAVIKIKDSVKDEFE